MSLPVLLSVVLEKARKASDHDKLHTWHTCPQTALLIILYTKGKRKFTVYIREHESVLNVQHGNKVGTVCLTFPETSGFASKYLSSCKSHWINLHTGDATKEETRITKAGSHSDWIVGSQSYSSNILSRHKPILHEQLSLSRPSVVRRSNKLPSIRCDTPAYHRLGETASPSTCKPHKQRPRCDHPEVHAPAVRHVVEDGPGATLVINPRHKSDGSFCVQLSTVWKLDVTAWFTQELVRAITCSVRSWCGPDFA